MKRYSPLKRKTELIRGAPLRNRGTKARRDAVEMKAAERDMGEKRCWLLGTLGAPEAHFCRGSLARHHVLPRSRGGTNDSSNLIWLCQHHHEWVHANPISAKVMGLLR